MTTVLDVQHIVKRYGDVTAVADLSFSVEQGHCVSLLGPSGCGKTTTLRVVAGFEQVDGGAVLINSLDMRGKRPYERNIGIVFQDYALFPHMTVEQNIAYGMRHRGVDRAEMANRMRELLALVRLAGYEARRPTQLSGGEQQRVALARALATRPALLLLDEPMSNLDAKLRDQVRVELKDIIRSVGITTILVTHDQQEAMSIADRIIVMNKGRKMQDGSPTDIYARPSNRFTAEFIGRTNWFTARLRRAVGPGLWTCEALTGESLVIVDGAAGEGEIRDIGVRPERLRVEPLESAMSAPDPRSNRLIGRVLRTEYLGADVHTWIGLETRTRILAVAKNIDEALLPEGTAVAVTFAAETCLVLPADPPAADG